MVAVTVLGSGAALFMAYSDAEIAKTDGADYTRPLAIPPLLMPTAEADGTKRFRLEMRTGRTELLPGEKTDTWGINGSHLGPTLRAKRGDKVAVDVTNALPETTTLHWHGMHLPPEMDGGPHQTVQPGKTWSPSWEIDQPASTLWYHPHLDGRTEKHVYRGLAGMWLLDDEESERLTLPQRYGVDDIPLILQDKRMNDDGELQGPPILTGKVLAGGPVGLVGDKIFVNGTYQPMFAATTTKVRMRVLNGSNGRTYHLGFADGRRFDLIGVDNGLLEKPAPRTRLPVSPGERVEIVVDVKPEDSVVLRSFPFDLGTPFPGNRIAGGDDTLDLLRIAAGDRLEPSPAVPARLAGSSLPDPPAGARTRTMHLAGQSYINNKTMNMSRVDEVLTAGTTEIWNVTTDEMPHSLHLHGTAITVMDVDGRPPQPWDSGPKDTVFLRPGGRTRIAVHAPKHASERFPYMFHCHVLFHEDRGMMGQFLAVRPGREEQVSRDLKDAHAHHGSD
ncbi:multicopper oxidase family protein [Actinoplanes utahensis]|uniref:multicopper oxidase family protein n=1 Tax=Actinoplanes utahensis TaxID=1869 RepID=UPI000AA9A455|nr:multicopper oxidase domain-containing protein [Actinoplanes utahensis]